MLMKNYEVFFLDSPISLFSYAQYYLEEHDKNLKISENYFLISTDLEWHYQRITTDWSTPKAVSPLTQAFKTNKPHPYIMPSIDQDDLMKAFCHRGYREGLTIYKREGLKIHAFSFAISKNIYIDSIANFYIAELTKLWEFCFIFLSNFESHCKKLETLPTARNKFVHYLEKASYTDQSQNINSVYKKTKLDKIKIFKDQTSLYITQHQLLLMEQISRGYSLKQIAYNMNLSLRTVQANYNLLKKNLELNSRDKIVSTWYENNI